jgi:putative sugar O-methyltransferase
VPTYEHSLYRKHRAFVNSLFRVKIEKNQNIPDIEGLFGTLSGYNKAKTDYRIFLATDTPKHPKISEIGESLVGEPQEYFNFDSKYFSRCLLNYLLGLNFLKNTVDTKNVKNVLEIGGGFGTLGEIFYNSDPDSFYVNVDIPPVSAVSSYYLSQVVGKQAVLTYDLSREMHVIDIHELKKEYRCAVLCPWQLPKIKGDFELFVNFMSFQEMEPAVVENYISHVERLTSKYVLLRNSRTGKKKAKDNNEIGVIEPTTMDDMVAMFKHFEVVNRNHKIYGDFSSNYVSELICLSRS